MVSVCRWAAPRDPDPAHLDRLAVLVRRYDPILISEHLAWSTSEAGFLNDLLPMPYTDATLDRVARNIDRVQTAVRRRILLENPATYLAFDESSFEETDFLAEIARRTGCGLLLDVNNVYVSSTNHGRDAATYLAGFPMERVEEIHLAGHSSRVDANGIALLVDSHDRPIAEPVWNLYRQAIAYTGPVRTLIERDADIPPWHELYAEARRAHNYLTADYLTAASEGAGLAVAC
ncbi:MAG: DUF692 domain-containing protein [Aliidongia sp.]